MLDKHSLFFFYHPPVSAVALCAEDNSLSGNQMLIKRKLHWIGAMKTGKIHPETPHKSSLQGQKRQSGRWREWEDEKRKEKMDRREMAGKKRCENVVRSQRQIETRETTKIKAAHRTTNTHI